MPDGDTITQVAVVILLLALAVPSLATAYDYAGTPIEYEETATVDYTTAYSVTQSATVDERYRDAVTVTAGGTALVRGTDYRWNATSGNVTVLNTSNTTSGDAVDIEYAAFQRTGETVLAWQLVSPFMALFGLLGLVASVRAVWQLTTEVWDL